MCFLGCRYSLPLVATWLFLATTQSKGPDRQASLSWGGAFPARHRAIRPPGQPSEQNRCVVGDTQAGRQTAGFDSASHGVYGAVHEVITKLQYEWNTFLKSLKKSTAP